MRRPVRLLARLLPLCLLAGACSDLAEPTFSQVAGVYTLDAPGPLQMRVDPRSQTVSTVTRSDGTVIVFRKAPES